MYPRFRYTYDISLHLQRLTISIYFKNKYWTYDFLSGEKMVQPMPNLYVVNLNLYYYALNIAIPYTRLSIFDIYKLN